MADFRYRHFVYVDSNEILNVAAILDEGEVVEELHRLTKDLGANVGLKFGLKLLGLDIGAKGGRNLEKEWKIRRTVYTSADRVLGKLDIKKFDTEGSVTENRVIQCDIRLTPPIRESEVHLSQWQKLWFGVSRKDIQVECAKLRMERISEPIIAAEFEVLGTGDRTKGEKVLVVLQTRFMLDLPGFMRRATIVGQVIGVKQEDEQLLITSNGDGVGYEFIKRHIQGSAECSSSNDSNQELPVSDSSPRVITRLITEPTSGARTRDAEIEPVSSAPALPDKHTGVDSSSSEEQSLGEEKPQGSRLQRVAHRFRHPFGPKANSLVSNALRENGPESSADDSRADGDVINDGSGKASDAKIVLRPIVIFK